VLEVVEVEMLVVLVEMLVLVEELVEELVVLVEVELDVVELVELLVELVDVLVVLVVVLVDVVVVLVEVVGSGGIIPSFNNWICGEKRKGTLHLAQRKDRTFPIVGRFRNRRKRSRPANI